MFPNGTPLASIPSASLFTMKMGDKLYFKVGNDAEGVPECYEVGGDGKKWHGEAKTVGELRHMLVYPVDVNQKRQAGPKINPFNPPRLR